MKLVLGSRNSHKLRELEALLRDHEITPLPDDVTLPPEEGAVFAENALAKARAAARSTGAPALGEDSGIAVEALGGGPGVRSARYAGENATDEENVKKLLGELDSVEGRRAAYVCALAFVSPDGEERLFEGECAGWIAGAPSGSGGFGYDPIFVPDDGPPNVTMASLPPEQKNAISHRGRAARQLDAWLGSHG